MHPDGTGRSRSNDGFLFRWVLTGLVLIGFQLILFWLSPRFFYGGAPLQRPILSYVSVQVAFGVAFLLAVKHLKNPVAVKGLIIWIVAVGFGMRVFMMGSTPILEDDYYRYLWDGAVTANGINPYAYAPGQILEGKEKAEEVPPVLFQLAEDSGTVISRINHPYLRTVYPTIAQAAFAVAYWLHPWSTPAWRAVLLVFDVLTFILIILILRALGLPSLYAVVYWWNPLLVKETFNTLHMDVLSLPFVLGAVLLTIRKKHFSAVVALALAMGTKLWPVVLLPLILRPVWGKPKRLISALLLFGFLGGLLFFPIYQGGLQSDSGFVAYGQKWEMNDALFMLFMWGAKMVASLTQTLTGQEKLIARAMAGLLLALWIGWLARYSVDDHLKFCERCLLVVAAVFLLSPAQFPWYYIWMLPFLALRPRQSLLLWTALLPIYYLRFYFYARGRVNVFDNGIVWLEHMPVYFLLIWEWYRNNRSRITTVENVSV